MLGVILLDGKNVNLEMVKAGLAEVYRGNPVRSMDLEPYRAAEKTAQEAKRGMWDQGEKYVSPRQWRHSSADKIQESHLRRTMEIAQQ